jgi:hypothetical protein
LDDERAVALDHAGPGLEAPAPRDEARIECHVVRRLVGDTLLRFRARKKTRQW